jgi:hypothetical protein
MPLRHKRIFYGNACLGADLFNNRQPKPIALIVLLLLIKTPEKPGFIQRFLLPRVFY